MKALTKINCQWNKNCLNGPLIVLRSALLDIKSPFEIATSANTLLGIEMTLAPRELCNIVADQLDGDKVKLTMLDSLLNKCQTDQSKHGIRGIEFSEGLYELEVKHHFSPAR